MELTKEYFDEQINGLNQRLDILPTNDTIATMQADITELKTDVAGVKTDITALQDDMRSVKSTLQEMNQTLTNLDKRDKEDSNAFAKTLVKHDERLTAIEQELKLKQA